MFKNQILFNLLIILGAGLFFSSCTKEDANVEVENYGFTESYEMQKNLNAGIHGCVELVFPVTIELPDGTSIEVESFEDAKDQLQAWRESNPDVEGRPHIVFPVEIITQEGEVVSVNSREEIRELVKECRSEFPRRPRHFRACFKIEYPVSISFPDGTEQEVSSRLEMKQTIRSWKQDNPDAEEKPQLVFPINILYEDGSSLEINSFEELRQAKKDCRE